MHNKTLEIAAKLFYRTILTLIINPDLEHMPGEELTQVQLSCLHFVCLHNEPSVGAIAEGLAISDAAAVKLIDRLVNKNLLVREEAREDRRVLKIKLTSQGASILEKYNSVQTQLFNEIIKRMPQEAVDALAQGLTEFLRAALVKPEQIDEVCLRCGWEHFPECPGNVRYLELTGEEKKEV